MNNESNQYIRESFFKWAADYGVDTCNHEEWNKFLSIWNMSTEYTLSGTLCTNAPLDPHE